MKLEKILVFFKLNLIKFKMSKEIFWITITRSNQQILA
jgi:hypothetical protein